VWVGDQKVAGKTAAGFPDETEVLDSVQRALPRG